MPSLTSSEVVVVLGTSGVVLPITEMALQFRGYKILNNLAPEPAINANVFERVFYQPATQAVQDIDSLLRSRLEGSADAIHPQP